MRRLRFLGPPLVVALAAFSSAVALAQTARTVPISQKLVTVTMLTPDGNPWTVSVHEGQMARVTDKNGVTIGFAAAISKIDPMVVTVRLMQITKVERGEAVEELALLTVGAGNFTRFQHARLPLQFRLERIDSPQSSGKSASRLQTGFEFVSQKKGARLGGVVRALDCRGGDCCVTCGDWTTCGCKVVVSCGSCCCSDCTGTC